MKPDHPDIPIATLTWSPDDLAIDLAARGYRITPAADLEALGDPVAWTIDHQDRLVYIDRDLDRRAFTRAVNDAYEDVRDHQPEALPTDRHAPTPDLTPWAVPATPAPGPDDWIERRYELHSVAYDRFARATAGYDRNAACLAALVWFCGLTPEEQDALTELQTAETIARVGPAGHFMGTDHRHIHVAIPPAVRRVMGRSTARAQKANPKNFLAGYEFAAAFYGFGLLKPDKLAGAMIDAGLMGIL